MNAKNGKPNTEVVNNDGRVLVYLWFPTWLANECEFELERSIERESGNYAEEEAERWRESDDDDDVMLEEEDISEILSDLCDSAAIKSAASPDFVDVVGQLLSAKIKSDLGLRFEGREGCYIVASISPLAAMMLSKANHHGRSPGDSESKEFRGRTVDDMSEELSEFISTFIEPDEVQQDILEHLACYTDALCCDRLLDRGDYELRAHRIRRKKRLEAKKAERKRELQ